MKAFLIQGSARRLPLAGNSVQCVATSPPYWSLRDYGIPPEVWGGDAGCEHEWGEKIITDSRGLQITPSGGLAGPQREDARKSGRGNWCVRCGAWRGCLGLEPDPKLFVQHMVEVFREARRVLRDDGTVWVNIGDSYSNGGTKWGGYTGGKHAKGLHGETSIGRQRVERSDLLNGLASLLERRVLFFGARCSLVVAPKGTDVLRADHSLPNEEFSAFFGVQRVSLKQGNDDLGQVLHLLAPEGGCCVHRSLRWRLVGKADIEITVDATNGVSIVATEDDLNSDATLEAVVGTSSVERHKASFPVKEAAKPVAEGIRDVQAIRDTIAIDATGVGLAQVNSVDQAVSLGHTLLTSANGLCDFRVVQASLQKFTLAMMGGRVTLAVRGVGHLFASNSFGSLVRYAELYDQADRKSKRFQQKQRVGIPWMFASAMQEDGWILRDEILWHKPNPMPESVTDRTTKAHEFLFLFSKTARYFYDADAIREPVTSTGGASFGPQTKGGHVRTADGGHAILDTGGMVQSRKLEDPAERNHPLGRNKRSVWTISTQSCPDAHFATFPVKLPSFCIQAGTSERGCCRECGAPWKRVTEVYYDTDGRGSNGPRSMARRREVFGTAGFPVRKERRATTAGWVPTCKCRSLDPIPCTVLDNFSGAATTGIAAARLGRRYIGIERKAEYIAIGRKRLANDKGPKPKKKPKPPQPNQGSLFAEAV